MRRAASALAALAFVLAMLPLTGAEAAANVVVGSGYSASYSGESAFTSVPAGASGQFSAIFFNDGSQPWQPGLVGLLVCLADKTTCNVASPNAAYASNWYSTTVYATVAASTAPGSNGFFIYNFKVPAAALPATTATFNGEVGLIGIGGVLRPQGYFQSNTTPLPLQPLSIAPASASVQVGGQLQFTSTIVSAWTVTGGCGAVTPTGLFAATATNSQSQPCKVVATSAGMTATASITVFGAPTTLACAAGVSALPADGTSTTTVTATLKDANGNVVANATSPAITFTNITATLDSVFPSGPQTPSAGVASVTLQAGLLSGGMQVTATSAGLPGCNVIVNSVVPGPTTQLSASFLVNPVAADPATLSTLRVDLKDANGIRAIGDSLTTISATRASSSASICSIGGIGSVAAVASQGRVDFSVMVTSTPGICQFALTADNTTIAGSQAMLTTQIVGAANKLAVVANDSPKTVSGGTSTVSITVDLQDARGLRVTGSTALVNATLDSATCTGAPSGVIYSTSGFSVGATQGRAIFTFGSVGAYPACAVTFTATGVTGTNASIRFDPGPPDHLYCSFAPAAILNDGISLTTGSVRLRDAYNNYVTNAGPYSITFVRSSGSSTNIVTPSPQLTVAGIATFSVRSRQVVGVDTYNATLTSGTLPSLVNAGSLVACSVSVQTMVP